MRIVRPIGSSVAEELLRDRLPMTQTFVFTISSLSVQSSPFVDAEAADREVRRRGAGERGRDVAGRRRRPARRSRATARRSLTLTASRAIALASLSVRRPVDFAAGAGLLDVLRIDEERVRAEAVDLVADARRCAARERSHHDDGRDADENAEHRQRRPQLVADDRRERQADAQPSEEPSCRRLFPAWSAAARAARAERARGSEQARWLASRGT